MYCPALALKRTPWRRGLVALAMLAAAACSGLRPDARIARATEMAAAAGWQSITLPAGQFRLAAFVPARPVPGRVLSVYIEGDGLAWINSRTPSDDPTPLRPLALQLALKHPAGPAAYLARPCQYIDAVGDPACRSQWWTDSRFAVPVIAATSLAIDELKRRFAADEIELIGYSGGGAVAALVAAGRQDVRRLVTVAGNLDPDAWVRHHRVAPLAGSLNPADAWKTLAGIPQIHFAGGKDKTVPPLVAQAYAARFPPDRQPRLRIVHDYDHVCCWAEDWPALYRADKD